MPLTLDELRHCHDFGLPYTGEKYMADEGQHCLEWHVFYSSMVRFPDYGHTPPNPELLMDDSFSSALYKCRYVYSFHLLLITLVSF